MQDHGQLCCFTSEDVLGSWPNVSLQGPHPFLVGELELEVHQHVSEHGGTMELSWQKRSSIGLGWVTSLAARDRRPSVALVSCP